MTRRLERVVRAAARRPGRVLAIAALIATVGGLLALRLQPSAATDTLVGRSTDAFAATERLHRDFGEDPVAVLVREDLKDLVLTADLGRLIGLEGCLSGNKPEGVTAPGGPGSPCARLAEDKPVQVVYGPGTFIQTAADEIAAQLRARLQDAQSQARAAASRARTAARRGGASPAVAARAASAASEAVLRRFEGALLQLANRYGLSLGAANPSIDNAEFVSSIVFEPGGDRPKPRFASLFPTSRAALVQVRLKPGLSDARRQEAIRLIRAAVAMPRWRLAGGGSYLVSGAPVLIEDVTRTLSASLVRLLVGGLLMMALVLPLVFRRRYRMLPLAVALAAAGTVFGLMSLLGGRLTLASIAVLPVLLGLGVDYAIQYQARLEDDGLRHTVRQALPTIGTAVLATVAGFAVLLLSPVPMVRGFGAVLMGGVVLAYAFALTAGTAALAWLSRRAGRGGRGGALTASLRGAQDLVAAGARPLAGPSARAGAAAARLAQRVVGTALRRPVAVLAAGAVLAVGGWAVDSRTDVVSDIQQLVPRDLPAVRDVLALQDATNIAGEVDVLVSGRDLTDPVVVQWMRSYQQRVERRFRYSAANGCGEAAVCPAISYTDLFRTPATLSSAARIRAVLDAVPDYFSRAVVTPDRRTAIMAFGLKLLPLDEQQRAFDAMRSRLDPPPGVTARLAGLPTLYAQANADLSDPGRRLGTVLAGLLLVLLALLAVHRRVDRAVVVVLPIALATGWSALVLWALGVPLNPMSATLGALVIALSTEFAVLLAARFREERDTGLDVAGALRRTYASTGAAVLASGVTAIAGFAVLAFSDITMLKDFGRVTVVDLTVSLLGVLAILPAVLTLAERRRPRAPEHPSPEREAIPA